MSKEWKLVPVEPTEEMLRAHGCNFDGLDDDQAREEWAALLAAVPVPPACGEPEIFQWLCRKYVQRADDRQKEMGLQYMEAETHDLAQEFHRAHVNGCADLASQVRELEHKMDYWEAQNKSLQSELTKARELLADAAQSLETISLQAGRDEFMKDMTQIRGYANSRARVAQGALSDSAEPANKERAQ